jgi:hypothetical protein
MLIGISSKFLGFINSAEPQIPRPVDDNKRKMYYSGKKKYMLSRISLWSTKMFISFIKPLIRKDEDMITYSV